MADYYEQFSIEIRVEESALPWLRSKLGYIRERHLDAGSDTYFDEYNFLSRLNEQNLSLWLYSDGEESPSAAAYFLRRYLRKFAPACEVVFPFACTCSKPRPDGFGGGAIRVTADGIECESSGSIMHAWAQAGAVLNSDYAAAE